MFLSFLSTHVTVETLVSIDDVAVFFGFLKVFCVVLCLQTRKATVCHITSLTCQSYMIMISAQLITSPNPLVCQYQDNCMT